MEIKRAVIFMDDDHLQKKMVQESLCCCRAFCFARCCAG